MPTLEVLLNVTGAQDVSFQGFLFEHATWLRPGQADGYVEQQTGACTAGPTSVPTDDYCNDDFVWSVKSPGNVAVLSSQRISFSKCEFARLGGTALDITWSESVTVADSYFHDISGGAVQIGSFQYPLGAEKDVDHIVRNSIVNKAGAEYSGAAGINVGYTQRVTIHGNDVSNMSYVPISVGWGWSRHERWNETNAGENVIAMNRAHDYKQTLNDGGGIYMLGPQNGSLIHDNWVYNQGTSSSGALYPDEGSAYSTFRSNVVTNIGKSEWLHLWTGSIHNVTVEGNFADTKTFINRGTNCPMVDNTIFEQGKPPPAAVKIMNASGVNASNPFFSVLSATHATPAISTAAADPAAWRLPTVDWSAGGARLPIPPGAKTVRAVDSIVWPGNNRMYIYSDVTPQGEIGAFSSADGRNWSYHGIVVHKNTSAADEAEVGTPSALVRKDGRVFLYFKQSAVSGPRGIGIATAAHPLGPFSRLPPAAAAPPKWHPKFGPGGIFDDSQVFEHEGTYHMLHSRKWSTDTPGCMSNKNVGRNDCIEWMVSADAEKWERRGVVLAAHEVGPRNCTKADKGLSCIEGGLEPMSARIYGDTLVLLTDGREFEVFVAPVSGLSSLTAAGLQFEKATAPFLSSSSYARLPKDYVATALRVMPRQGKPRFCGVSESAGGLSFVVYPLASRGSQ
jgi:hypothetical protein